MNVTRQEALDFLNIATRNWPDLPSLSEDDIGDVATALLAFAVGRLPTAEDAKAEAHALAERAGLDIGDDHDMFVDDLAKTLVQFASRTPTATKGRTE